MPEEPGLADVIAEQRELLSRLRAVVEAKDAENQVLRAELETARERERRLEQAGFDAAMCAALAAEPVLAADETPVNVLAPSAPAQAAGPEEKDPDDGERRAPGAPHVLVIRTPAERLTWLQALGSRRKQDVTAGVPPLFTGFLITDGYKAYQRLLSRLAGVQQCCARHPQMPRHHQTRPRQPPVLGRRRDHHPARGAPGGGRKPVPAGTPP
ncbi:MAG: hypothetical protein WAL72_24020 [Streptosporangiaceae bacterium]